MPKTKVGNQRGKYRKSRKGEDQEQGLTVPVQTSGSKGDGGANLFQSQHGSLESLTVSVRGEERGLGKARGRLELDAIGRGNTLNGGRCPTEGGPVHKEQSGVIPVTPLTGTTKVAEGVWPKNCEVTVSWNLDRREAD